MTGSRRWHIGVCFAAGALAALLGRTKGEAHKLISSKYTYNEDVFPILRDRCGRCHVSDGVAPMSLMTFKDAYPWSESLRAELVTGHMPPWHVLDDIGAFKNASTITAPEIDKILTWASGGYPEGNPLNPPPDVEAPRNWPLGQPDLVLEPSMSYTMAADQSETTVEMSLATGTTEPKWIRAVDLLPGTPAIVRNATVTVKAMPGDAAAMETTPARVLSVWIPGDDPVAADRGTAFQLPAGAEIVVRIHYKKTYKFEGKEMTDRSRVGLYFTQGPVDDIRSLTITSPTVVAAGQPLMFSRTLVEDLNLLAFYPDPSLSNARLEITVVKPDGTQMPLVHLAVRPDWTRRYWFAQALALPHGTQIQVVAILNGADGLLPPAAAPTPPQVVRGPVRITFDVAAARLPRVTN
jgi:hypothetical protein